MSEKRILSVGQCSADHGAITRTFSQHFQAKVIGADSADETLALLRRDRFDLILINRVLDAEQTYGLEIIRALKADETLAATPVMLVSNYEDAQKDAVAAGALPGFGKASLGQPAMLARVRKVLNPTA